MSTVTQNQTDTTKWDLRRSDGYVYHNNGQMRSIWQYENGAYVSTECLAYDGLSQLTEDWTTNQGSAGCQAPSTATVSGPAAFRASYRNGIGTRNTEIQ